MKIAILMFVTVTLAMAIPGVARVESRRVSVRADFHWPASANEIPSANRTRKALIEEFLTEIVQWPQGEKPFFGEFRFVPIEGTKVCLVAGWGGRDASIAEVACPLSHGFQATPLPAYAPGPLAWYVVDLKGDGEYEVISSELVGSYGPAVAAPVYWYDIYDFKDGLPHDVSQQFKSFYQSALLVPLATLERMVMPPLGSGSKRNSDIEADIISVRFRYRREILGEKTAGLAQALVWARSDDANLQSLGVSALGEINDPSSISELERLARSSNQGVCVTAVDALARLQNRAPETAKVLACESTQR